MSKKDSLLIPRRGFLRSSAIGIAVSGIPNSNADNYSEEIKVLREEVYKHPKVNEWMLKTYGKII